MALSNEAYAGLQEIVGERNVTRDPAILDGYAVQMLAELVRPNCSHYMPRAAAIVHAGVHRRGAEGGPAGQQVQVRHQAPRHRLVPLGVRHVRRPGHVQLDMRRMNKIEIDEKNGIAIVEPYVIHAQLAR